jgi:hypothetical protein
MNIGYITSSDILDLFVRLNQEHDRHNNLKVDINIEPENEVYSHVSRLRYITNELSSMIASVLCNVVTTTKTDSLLYTMMKSMSHTIIQIHRVTNNIISKKHKDIEQHKSTLLLQRETTAVQFAQFITEIKRRLTDALTFITLLNDFMLNLPRYIQTINDKNIKQLIIDVIEYICRTYDSIKSNLQSSRATILELYVSVLSHDKYLTNLQEMLK